MDDRGFIFTTDAVLALVVFFVFTASIVTYYTLPSYIGADHQHLEAQAADALQVMTDDGTLYASVAQLANNNTTIQNKGRNNLTTELENLLNGNGTNNNTAYKLSIKLENGSTIEIGNNKSVPVSKDTVTRVTTISGPKQGWMGRAWYKIEDVEFENQTINSTTTLWNFHNWLSNFSPWKGTYGGQLATYYYWGSASGSPSTSIPIVFSFPKDANITGGVFLLGSANKTSFTNARAFGSNVTVNGNVFVVNSTNFTALYNRSAGSYRYYMFNYKGSVPANKLFAGNNSFFVRFTSPVASGTSNSLLGHDMPWFSMLGNYSNSILVPSGIITKTFKAPDAAGVAVPDPSGYAKDYDLDSGTITTYSGQRAINWNSMVNQNHSYSDGIPFDILNLPSGDDGAAVSTTHDVPIPTGSNVKDAYTVINAYGGVDCALVEVWNGTNWITVFNSFDLNGTDYSARSDGYGNTPGIIYIGDKLVSGVTNKVRITVWDNVPSTDYDLVGLVNCYTTVSYSAFPIRWVNFPFDNYQNSTNTTSPQETFDVGLGAEKILMFFGTGLDTRNVAVQVKNNTSSTWKTLYNSTTDGGIPFVLDIGDLDLQKGTPYIFTSGTVGNYTGKQGSYDVRVIANSGPSWQSGDYGGTSSTYQTYSNAEIYSGTRVSVIYPKFLDNVWATEFADDPTSAQNAAYQSLKTELGLNDSAASSIKTEALYTGNMPNSIVVRLDLWKS